MKNYSAPPGLCTVPGCGQPRYVNRYGKRSTRCAEHVRQQNQSTSRKRKLVTMSEPVDIPENTPARRKPVPAPETVRVMVIDWQTEHVFHVIGTIADTEPFPRTDGEMKKAIAQASKHNVYVAYIRAYKEEDLYESN